MKTLLTILLLCNTVTLYAQKPTAGLVQEFDFTSVVSTTLTDISGAAHNGTLHGTTQANSVTTCNGTTDWIDTGQLIGNSDFTVMVAASPTVLGAGAMWGETNVGNSQLMRLSAAGTSTTTAINSGGTSAAFSWGGTSSTFLRNPDYDIFVFSRKGLTYTLWRMSRLNNNSTVSIANGTVTTTGGAICALNSGAAQVNFLTGSLGWFMLWNRQLSKSELFAAYNYMTAQLAAKVNPIYIRPAPEANIPTYTSPVWRRVGSVIKFNNCFQPIVIYDTTPQILTSAQMLGQSNLFKMWCNDNTNVYYNESVDGVDWYPKAALNQLASLNAACDFDGVAVVKANGTYHLYCTQNSTKNLRHFTSSDGVNAWTLVGTALSKGGAGQWDNAGISNPDVKFFPNLNPQWYMMWDNITIGLGGATSTDGTNWTKTTVSNPSPVSTTPFMVGNIINDNVYGQTATVWDYASPSFWFVNGQWYVWTGNFDIQRFTSPQFNAQWVLQQQHFTVQNNTSESNQISDPCIIEVNGKTYLYYYPVDASGTARGIALMIADIPLAVLVQTNEGTLSDTP